MAIRVVRQPATIVAHLTCSRIRNRDANEGDRGAQMVSLLRHHQAVQLCAVFIIAWESKSFFTSVCGTGFSLRSYRKTPTHLVPTPF